MNWRIVLACMVFGVFLSVGSCWLAVHYAHGTLNDTLECVPQ